MTDDPKKPQIEKFREKARELETDDSEEAFERLVRKISKHKPAKDGEEPEKPPRKGKP